ncbi:uncharacterized protein LOC119099268 isoform X1 [Pollicipes pollicipes]|uniref:uncharacterized protein LOC119099268 isoform X1 n=1 Tax=Pollicipes pollicipes TaxID=41117 RepID=UPI0018852EC7|nr:uncharacterized protein LOC119099268 isoform X1 [Pollicipes pollicipes]
MKHSLYDVQKKAEEGEQVPPPLQPPPPRPSKACLWALLMLCMVLMLTLAVTLAMILVTRDGPLSLWEKTASKSESKSAAEWNAKTTKHSATHPQVTDTEAGAVVPTPNGRSTKHVEKEDAAIATTESPLRPVIPPPSVKTPTAKVWVDVKEVIYVYPRRPKPSSSDSLNNGQTNTAAPKVKKKPDTVDASANPNKTKSDDKEKHQKDENDELFAQFWPIFTDMMADAGKEVGSVLRRFLPDLNAGQTSRPSQPKASGTSSKPAAPPSAGPRSRPAADAGTPRHPPPARVSDPHAPVAGGGQIGATRRAAQSTPQTGITGRRPTWRALS